MPNLNQHLRISKQYLGYSDENIHKFLDAVPERHFQHRRLTHGYTLLKLIEREWGRKAALESFTHILADQKLITLTEKEGS